MAAERRCDPSRVHRGMGKRRDSRCPTGETVGRFLGQRTETREMNSDDMNTSEAHLEYSRCHCRDCNTTRQIVGEFRLQEAQLTALTAERDGMEKRIESQNADIERLRARIAEVEQFNFDLTADKSNIMLKLSRLRIIANELERRAFGAAGQLYVNSLRIVADKLESQLEKAGKGDAS